MGLYNKQGLYSGYKKNNAEREALDYYATPTNEVLNILNTINLDFSNSTILEPSCGGGHMVAGIKQYIQEHNMKNAQIIATDIVDRPSSIDFYHIYGSDYDFLGDNYPHSKMDYVIMNPPYSTIEPFVIRGLEIAQKGLLLIGRLQFLEGKGRYENILSDAPPSDTYIYVDRIKCYKNGDFSQTESSAQAYAWFYWDKQEIGRKSSLHWIRANKK